jgi:tRNA 2-selenouridine synthase
MNPSRPVLVEAESSKIGRRTLPPAIWRAMETAPRITLSAPIEVRAAYLVHSYPDVIADRALLEQVLSRLEVYPGRKQLANWRDLADAGDFPELVRQVVERHYDPAYAKFTARDERPRLGAVPLPDLDKASLDRAATTVLKLMNQACDDPHLSSP